MPSRRDIPCEEELVPRAGPDGRGDLVSEAAEKRYKAMICVNGTLYTINHGKTLRDAFDGFREQTNEALLYAEGLRFITQDGTEVYVRELSHGATLIIEGRDLA